MNTVENPNKIDLAYPNPFESKESPMENASPDTSPLLRREDSTLKRQSTKLKKLDSLSVVASLKSSEYLLPEQFENLDALKKDFKDGVAEKRKRNQKLVKFDKGKHILRNRPKR